VTSFDHTFVNSCINRCSLSRQLDKLMSSQVSGMAPLPQLTSGVLSEYSHHALCVGSASSKTGQFIIRWASCCQLGRITIATCVCGSDQIENTLVLVSDAPSEVLVATEYSYRFVTIVRRLVRADVRSR